VPIGFGKFANAGRKPFEDEDEKSSRGPGWFGTNDSAVTSGIDKPESSVNAERRNRKLQTGNR